MQKDLRTSSHAAVSLKWWSLLKGSFQCTFGALILVGSAAVADAQTSEEQIRQAYEGSSGGPPAGSSSGGGYPGGSGSGPPTGYGSQPGSSGSGYPGGSGSGYPGGSGYSGSSYGNTRSRRGSDTNVMREMLQQFVVKAAESTNIASLADPESAPPIASGPVLLNEATVAYAKGASSLARQLYFGHMVAEFENAQGQLSAVKYSKILKRPVWQIRWGISMAVRGDATDPQPIKETAPRSTGGPGDGMGPPDAAMMAEYAGGMMEDQSGGYNEDEMRAQMEMEMGNMSSPDGMDMYGGDGMYGQPGGRANALAVAPKAPTPGERLEQMERSMTSDEAAKELEDNLGAVVAYLGEQFDQRYAEGSFGQALTDVTGEAGQPDVVSGEFVDLLEGADSDPPLWRPGIVYLGRGHADENLAAAKRAGIDLVIHIDVLLKPLRGGDYTQNISRCRLIHVATGKSLGASGSIDSLEFKQQSRTKGLGSREYIEEQLSNFVGIIDRQTVASDLPQLTPAVATNRIGTLLASGGSRNLQTLAEVRLFQQQGLLNEDQVMQVFDIVGGDEGLQLLFGTEDEKLSVVRKWISDQYAGGNSDS
ncbi:hypothetical protein U8335_00620 [Roseiconus lacunae]|uniref:hypothetical protein n=1 Tax=Roseiconus lacunae TaxID=2605694 RepID=UPI00308DC310|nr:hypothetical protein U8335_00620 [Stieleria sp. HD01]